MKFIASVATIMAFLATTQACGIKGCTGDNGQGTCTPVKDQQDGGCHSLPGAPQFRSFVWSGSDCGGSSKHLCGWDSGACNGAKREITTVNIYPNGGIYNAANGGRSWKFMNSGYC